MCRRRRRSRRRRRPGPPRSTGPSRPSTRCSTRPARCRRVLAAVACLLLGFGAAPIAIVSKLGVVLSQDYRLPDFGPLGLLFMAPIGLVLVAGGIGLLLRQPWAWSLALMSLLCGTAYYSKLVLPVYVHLRWEHRDARQIALAVGVFQGLPLLLFVAALTLLLLPAVRATMRTARAHPRKPRRRH